MNTISSSMAAELENALLDFAWMQWTQLGVRGVVKRNATRLILLEELVLLTAQLGEADPRLRNEALDWCSKYGNLISVPRLKGLLLICPDSTVQLYSEFAVTLQTHCHNAWPIPVQQSPLKVTLSGKSTLHPLQSPPFLNVRARCLYGVGARADVLTMLASNPDKEFSASQLETALSYSKRTVAVALEDLVLAAVATKFAVKNQLHFCLKKSSGLLTFMGPTPSPALTGLQLFKLIVPLLSTLKHAKSLSESSQAAELASFLRPIAAEFERVSCDVPTYHDSISQYMEDARKWLGSVCALLA